MRVKDYWVLEESSRSELEQQVLAYSRVGWELAGGVSVRSGRVQNYYSQAMVKYSEEDTPQVESVL